MGNLAAATCEPVTRPTAASVQIRIVDAKSIFKSNLPLSERPIPPDRFYYGTDEPASSKMYAKLEGFEIPDNSITTIILGTTGDVRIKGKSTRGAERNLISEGLGHFAIGNTVRLEAADSYGNKIAGSAEIKNIEVNESSGNYYARIDFAISLKVK